jgi:methionyl aminopeptidase
MATSAENVMSIESKGDLKGLRQVGKIVSLALREIQRNVRPGVTTAELDEMGAKILKQHGARSAPMLFYKFPAAICISINDEAIHGIPGHRIIQAGDLVKLDITAEKDGYIADAAITVAVLPVSDEKFRLIECSRQAFYGAMSVTRAGSRIRDIGRAVENEVTRSGFAVIRELAGHGVGRAIHEKPIIPNYFDFRHNKRLTNGLVITVEPIVAAGSGRAFQAEDGWTVKTADGSLSAHYEHTIVVTKGYPVLLTAA